MEFNYRHLYYFWVVAKAGGLSRGAARLNMAVQTVSAQVRQLEHALGYVLLKPMGRGVELTDAGRATMRQAEQIFQLGEQLPSVIHDAVRTPTMRLSVGISDGLPKMVVRRLLQPIIHEATLRLLCLEDRFEELLAGLSLHRLDIVLADRPAPTNPNVKLYTHFLGSSAFAWYASEAHFELASRDFPHCLATLPILLPTAHNVVRARIDQWFERITIKPRVVGEFEDSALLKTFGASGMGIFPAAEWVQEDLAAAYQVRRVGTCEGVQEDFYAIGAEKKVLHPLVQRILATAHGQTS